MTEAKGYLMPAKTVDLEIDFDYHKEVINTSVSGEIERINPNDLIKGPTWVSKELDGLWLENYKKNKPYLKLPFKTNRMNETFILVGASPAIKRNIHFLKNLPEGFVLISPNTTVKHLLKKGIKPDYVFAIEGKDNIAQDFDFDSTGMTLLTSPFVCHEAVAKWRGDLYTYFLSGGQKYKQAIEKDWTGKCDFDIGGGNVLSTSYLWAYKYLNARHFIVMGMSLCYYDDKDYYFDGREKKSDPLEHWAKWLKAVDMYGTIVTTTPPLLMYKTWLEAYVKYAIEYGGGSFINATEDGILGVLPEIIEQEGLKVRLQPKYIPWFNITPLYLAIEGHKQRMEDIKNGIRK